jgi:hypothetical protein
MHVSDFGAQANGCDDTEAIQFAIDAAADQVLELDSTTYRISAPLVVSRRLRLAGGFRTRIQAIAPMPHMVVLRSAVVMSDLVFDGNWQATHVLRLEGCSDSVFDRVEVGRAVVDGVHMPREDDAGRYVINDRNAFRECFFTQCGRVHRTPGFAGEYLTHYVLHPQVVEILGATAAVDATRRVLTFAGWDPSFLRVGTPIRVRMVGPEGESFDEHRMVSAVGDSTLTLAKPLTAAHPVVDWAVGHGDGYHEVRHGDNNIHAFYGGLARSNAGYQLAFGGLYGPKMWGTQVDAAAFWPIRVGESGSGPVLGAIFDGLYFEGNAGAGANFLLAGAQNFTIRNVTERGGGTAVQTETAFPTGVRGAYIGNDGITSLGDGGFRVHAESTALNSPVVRGAVNWRASQMFVGNPANPYAFDPAEPVDTGVGSVVWISTPVQGLTLAGTPALTCVAGRMVWLVNRGPGELTLQDRSTRGGSALWLSGQRDRVLPRWSGIALACDGFRWVEVGSAPIGGGE